MSEDIVVQSLARGLSVIRVFDERHPELTLSDVARLSGLTRAAARRFLHTLVQVGYVRNDGHQFSLSPRVLELGTSYLSSLALPAIALPHMERLVAEVHESCSLSVLDDQDIVYVARMPADRIATLTITVGTRFPAYATSMGRVLLAGLDASALALVLGDVEFERLTSRTVSSRGDLERELTTVRSNGYCIVDQELEEGLISVAVPIAGSGGATVAALNLAMDATRNSLKDTRRLVRPLLTVAAGIAADLSGTAAPDGDQRA